MNQTPSARPRPPEDELARLRLATDFSLLPRAHGEPALSGVIRSRPEDFVVREDLPFELGGQGEHLYLRIRKTGQNTRWIAKRLAEAAGLPYSAVGYAGLKDRRAVAEQWFSLHLPGQPDPDASVLAGIEGVEVLEQKRHNAKLRTGAVAANHFNIRIRELDGDTSGIEDRLRRIQQPGVPNYFGPQRFGRGGASLDLLLEPGRLNREKRAFGLSALRGALFNGYLAMRLTDGSWERLLDGEIPARGDSFGRATGLLWGSGKNRATGDALAREQAWFTLFPGCLEVLESYRTRMMRRALAVLPAGLEWRMDAGEAELRFSLPKGAYATAVLRELGRFSDAEAEPADGP